MALYLEPLNGGRQIVLDKAVVLVGRQSDCDAVLDSSRKVSRKHCAIAQVNDRFMVRDLESMNGVTVNGNRVKREAPLQLGDEISIGDVRYVLRDTIALQAAPAVARSVAGKPSKPPAAVPPRPANISQKFPVPIAEEGVDFAVEPSLQFLRAPLSPKVEPLEPVLELVLDEPEPAAPPPRDADQQLPEVIILDDSVEIDAPRKKRNDRRD
jgi:hypothetical protein